MLFVNMDGKATRVASATLRRHTDAENGLLQRQIYIPSLAHDKYRDFLATFLALIVEEMKSHGYQ